MSNSWTGIADRIAAETLAKRGVDYAHEVRRLLDAAFAVIERNGTEKRARVADIVAEAGLSNDAFYRHFSSKDALIAALIEDGAQRLAGYVAHQMAKEPTAEAQIKRWVAGVLSQTVGKTAATTRAVLWNGRDVSSRDDHTTEPLAALLHEPLTALGSVDPHLDASLIANAVVGRVAKHLRAGTKATPREIDHITEFCRRGTH